MINQGHKDSNRAAGDEAAFRSADESGIPVPSRILLIELMSSLDRPLDFGTICKNFKITGKAAKKALWARLDRMQQGGLLIRDRKDRYALPDKMDIVTGRVEGHSNGHGFVIPDDGSGRLFLHHRQMRKVLHGDRVLSRVRRIDDRGRKEGVVIEVIVDSGREIVGHYQFESGVGFVEPDDSRYARDITIPRGEEGKATDGDIVVVRVLKHPVEHQHAVGRIVEVLGARLGAGMETRIAMRKHNLPEEWPQAVHDQVGRMELGAESVVPGDNRRDLRQLPLVTIDGADARDFDDAVCCTPREGGGWRLYVAIADVSHYVQAGSALDIEALNRGNSVYFPNRVIPMLPEQLSNGICSLNPGEDRYCMVCDMEVDAGGHIDDYRFYPALMHSHGRLTYQLMWELVDEKLPALRKEHDKLVPHLDELFRLYQVMSQQRSRRGAIDFEFPEPLFQFDENEKISTVGVRTRNSAHRLIEECMLAANVCAARCLQEQYGNAAMYRNHDGPDSEAVTELHRALGGLGLRITGENEPRAIDYSKLVASLTDRQEIAAVVQVLLLRSLGQAVYSAESSGHFALAYPEYTHFTSPIRRYSDLVVHRLIRQAVSGKKASKPPFDAEQLQQIAEHVSFSERRADDASRDVIAWLKAEFMQERIGQEFGGVITSVREFGVFVQLEEVFVDGLVHVTGLGDDYFHYDPLRFQLFGERTGRRFRLGDRLRVIVVRVDLGEAKIDFDLVSDESGSPAKSSPEGKTTAGKRKRRGQKGRKGRKS